MVRLMRVATAALTLVIAGCGTVAGTGNSASSSSALSSTVTLGPPTHRSLSAPSTPSAPATPVGNVLTAADSGATVTLRTGQRLTVELAPGSGVNIWDRPRLTGSGLRLLSVTGGYPNTGLMRAVFLATGPGTAVLSSSSDMPCLHENPRCLVAQRQWTATVKISR